MSRLRNGFIRKSPIIDMSSALSAIAISEPQHGRFHQLAASSRICSCISVTPIASTGIGPSTVRTRPECTPIVGFAMFVPSFLQLVRRPVRNRRKLSQIAIRMMNPSTIGVMNGDIW